jgi:hypothetical protein
MATNVSRYASTAILSIHDRSMLLSHSVPLFENMWLTGHWYSYFASRACTLLLNTVLSVTRSSLVLTSCLNSLYSLSGTKDSYTKSALNRSTSTLESILSSFSLAWAIILVFNELASSVFILLSSSVSCNLIQ